MKKCCRFLKQVRCKTVHTKSSRNCSYALLHKRRYQKPARNTCSHKHKTKYLSLSSVMYLKLLSSTFMHTYCLRWNNSGRFAFYFKDYERNTRCTASSPSQFSRKRVMMLLWEPSLFSNKAHFSTLYSVGRVPLSRMEVGWTRRSQNGMEGTSLST